MRTIAEAWRRVMSRGGTIMLRAGTYSQGGPLQLRDAAGGPVAIEAAPGARVSIADQVSLWDVRNVTLKNIHFLSAGRGLTGDWPLAVDGCSSGVRIVNGSGLRFAVVQAYHVLFKGGAWGGYGTDGDQDSMITSDPTRCAAPGPITHDIVFDGVTFHDVFWGLSSARLTRSHPDCLEANGAVSDVTIKNSRFVRCSNSFLMFATNAMGEPGLRDIVIEHNVFRGLFDSYFGIQLADGTAADGWPTCSGVVFRSNLYDPGASAPTGVPFAPLRILCRGQGHARIVGNVLRMRNYENLVQVSRGPPWYTIWSGNKWEATRGG